MSSYLNVFKSRKMAAITLLGFASGLPYLLTREALQAWMIKSGLGVDTVVWLTSLVGIPYSFKFLWSPLIDRFAIPFLGRRRGWIVLIQLLLVVAIALMSQQNPSQGLYLLAINAVLIAFLGASQDITIDAYRTDVLKPTELGAGAGVFVLGYRIAILVTGWLGLRLADQILWPQVYLVMAGLMVLSLITPFWAPEAEDSIKPPADLIDSVVLPFQDFFRRYGDKGAFILVFIVLYKLGDSLAAVVSLPFLLKTGFSQTVIADVRNGLGLIATIVGTLTGGAILSRIGVNRSLWIFGGLQAISNLGYLILALSGQNYPVMVLTVNIENFCAGLGTAAFVGFLMSLCNPSFSATQYALLSSLMAVSRDLVVSPAGELAKATSWPMFFFISIVIAIPGLLLLPFFAPWNEKEGPP